MNDSDNKKPVKTMTDIPAATPSPELQEAAARQAAAAKPKFEIPAAAPSQELQEAAARQAAAAKPKFEIPAAAPSKELQEAAARQAAAAKPKFEIPAAAPSQELQELAAREAEVKAKEEAKVKAQAESEAKAKAKEEEAARAKAEAEAKAKAEAEAKAKAEAEAKAKAEAEARAKAEAEARAKAEAEARAKAEAEAKAKAEAEAKARAEAEARAKAEAEARAKAEAEAARLKAEAEAARAKAEAEAKARAEAEAARLKAEQEAKAKAEAEAKAKAEAEAKARAEAEARAKAEAEAARLKAEAEAKAKAEAEAARLKAEQEAKAKAEAEAKAKAEAEAKAKAEAEAKAKAEAEAKAKAEAEAKAKAEAEAKAKAEAEAKAAAPAPASTPAPAAPPSASAGLKVSGVAGGAATPPASGIKAPGSAPSAPDQLSGIKAPGSAPSAPGQLSGIKAPGSAPSAPDQPSGIKAPGSAPSAPDQLSGIKAPGSAPSAPDQLSGIKAPGSASSAPEKLSGIKAPGSAPSAPEKLSGIKAPGSASSAPEKLSEIKAPAAPESEFPSSPPSQDGDDPLGPPKTGKSFPQSKMLIKALIACVVLAVLGGVGYFVGYAQYLLTVSVDLLEQGDYRQAEGYALDYEKIAGRSEQSMRVLARTRLFAGDSSRLASILKDYNEEDAELRYMQALAIYTTDPKSGRSALQRLFEESKDQHPYVFAADGIFYLLEDQYQAALPHLEDVSAAPGDSNADQHLRALFAFFWHNSTLDIGQAVPVEFAHLTGSSPEHLGILGFDISSEGYSNSYGVPRSPGAYDADGESSPVRDLFRGLYLLAQIQASPDQGAELIAAEVEEGNTSLLARYLNAYYLALGGEVAQAAEIYQGIVDDAPFTEAYQYLGAALWQSQNGDGSPPSQEVLDAYERAVQLSGQNVIALNNYAYLQFNFGNADEATALIERASDVSTTNTHVAMNRVLIGLVNGSLPIDKAYSQTEALLLQSPGSIFLRQLAAHIESLRGNFSDAIENHRRIAQLNLEDARPALRVADLYHYQGQMLLAVTGLAEAYTFSGLDRILGALAYYQAKLGDTQGAERTLGEISSDDPAALHAKFILMINDENPDIEAAAALGERALAEAAEADKTAVAIDLARWYLNTEQPVEKSTAALQVARDAAPHSLVFGLNLILDSIGYRIRIAQGEPVLPEVERALVSSGENNNVFVQIDMGRALVDLNRAGEGIEVLENVRSKRVRAPYLLRALINAYEEDSRPELASKTRQQLAAIAAGAEKFSSNQPTSNTNRVFQSREKTLIEINKAIAAKDYEGAIDLFTFLIEEVDNSKLAKPALNFQNRGALYMTTKRYGLAIDDFATALGMSEQLSLEEADSVHYNYVHALVQDQQYEEAEKQLRKRLAGGPPGTDENAVEPLPGAEFPHERAYLRLLASALSRLGKQKEVRDVYQTLIDRYPRDVSNYISLGDIAMVGDNFDLATSVLTQGLEIDPQNIKMHEMLYEIYSALGDNDNALRHQKLVRSLRNQ